MTSCNWNFNFVFLTQIPITILFSNKLKEDFFSENRKPEFNEVVKKQRKTLAKFLNRDASDFGAIKPKNLHLFFLFFFLLNH